VKSASTRARCASVSQAAKPLNRANLNSRAKKRRIVCRYPNEFASIIYKRCSCKHDSLSCGETKMPQASQIRRQIKIMGDKSPKANQKKSGQKDSKINSANQKKIAAIASQSSAAKKK
jgi:hypothetical protein